LWRKSSLPSSSRDKAAEEIIMHIFDMVATRQHVDAQRLLSTLRRTRVDAHVIHKSYKFASMRSYSSFNVQLRQLDTNGATDFDLFVGKTTEWSSEENHILAGGGRTQDTYVWYSFYARDNESSIGFTPVCDILAEDVEMKKWAASLFA
jgi:hypothetical protein